MRSHINWKEVGYIVVGCWFVCALLFVVSRTIDWPLNPIASVFAAVFGILIRGFVGAGERYEPFFDLLYWTFFGLCLGLWLQTTKRHSGIIISLALVIHVVFSVLALLPLLVLKINR
jgi:hypothetical protein